MLLNMCIILFPQYISTIINKAKNSQNYSYYSLLIMSYLEKSVAVVNNPQSEKAVGIFRGKILPTPVFTAQTHR